MRAKRSSALVAGIRDVVTMAPALIRGFAGRPASSKLIALNASPLGSTPTCSRNLSKPISARTNANTKGFEIDWIVNVVALSPVA